MTSFIRNLFYCICLLIWSFNLDTEYIYVVLLVLLALSLIVKPRVFLNNKIDFLVFSLFTVWLYGVLLGLFKGNSISFIISNFAGLSLILFYFILVSYQVSLAFLYKIALYAGVINIFHASIKIIPSYLGLSLPTSLEFIGDVGISSTGQLRVYYSVISIVYLLLGVSFARLFFLIKLPYKVFNKNSFFFFLISLSTLIFFTASKGFLLGVIVVLFILFWGLFLPLFFKGKIPSRSIWLMIAIVSISFFFERMGYVNILTDMFSVSDDSNIQRYIQLDYLLADLTFWGNGLGAVVPGVIRSTDAPYGFELTYLNIIHKFGVFSVVIFYSYIVVFLYSVKCIFNRKKTFYAVCMISLMGYLFPGIGNPLLFHPSLVLVHVLALYTIRKIKYEENFSLYDNI